MTHSNLVWLDQGLFKNLTKHLFLAKKFYCALSVVDLLGSMAECMLHVGFSSGTNMCKGRRWCVNILQVVLQYHLHLFSISPGFEKLEEWYKWRPKSIICYLVLPILRRLSGFIVAVCFFILIHLVGMSFTLQYRCIKVIIFKTQIWLIIPLPASWWEPHPIYHGRPPQCRVRAPSSGCRAPLCWAPHWVPRTCPCPGQLESRIGARPFWDGVRPGYLGVHSDVLLFGRYERRVPLEEPHLLLLSRPWTLLSLFYYPLHPHPTKALFFSFRLSTLPPMKWVSKTHTKNKKGESLHTRSALCLHHKPPQELRNLEDRAQILWL